jgi:hypothetical protein
MRPHFLNFLNIGENVLSNAIQLFLVFCLPFLPGLFTLIFFGALCYVFNFLPLDLSPVTILKYKIVCKKPPTTNFFLAKDVKLTMIYT